MNKIKLMDVSNLKEFDCENKCCLFKDCKAWKGFCPIAFLNNKILSLSQKKINLIECYYGFNDEEIAYEIDEISEEFNVSEDEIKNELEEARLKILNSVEESVLDIYFETINSIVREWSDDISRDDYPYGSLLYDLYLRKLDELYEDSLDEEKEYLSHIELKSFNFKDGCEYFQYHQIEGANNLDNDRCKKISEIYEDFFKDIKDIIFDKKIVNKLKQNDINTLLDLIWTPKNRLFFDVLNLETDKYNYIIRCLKELGYSIGLYGTKLLSLNSFIQQYGVKKGEVVNNSIIQNLCYAYNTVTTLLKLNLTPKHPFKILINNLNDSSFNFVDISEICDGLLIENYEYDCCDSVNKDCKNCPTNILENVFDFSDRIRNILILKYGLIDGKEKTIEEISSILNLPRYNVERGINRGLVLLASPYRKNKLKKYLEIIFKDDLFSKYRNLMLAVFDGKDNVEGIIEEIKNGEEIIFSLDTTIEDLGLSIRTYNCLKRAGLQTLQDLLEKSEDDLLRVRNLGRTSLKEVLELKGKYLFLVK